MTGELRIAALIKQIPRFEEMRLGDDGRMIRDDSSLEINPYCRRAASMAISLARETGGKSTVVTLGPPQAAEALKEMLAAGADEAVLITDPRFAGSDTLATARALVAALRIIGPFDIVLCGLNSVDADTGQVGPEVAELIGLPFVAGVRTLDLRERELYLGCERDDGWREVVVELPAVISASERLCPPAKAKPEIFQTIANDQIRRLDAASLGSGPWGSEGSPTRVGKTRILTTNRGQIRLSGTAEMVSEQLIQLLFEKGIFEEDEHQNIGRVQSPTNVSDQYPIAVVIEPGKTQLARELLGKAAEIAAHRNVNVVALVFDDYNSMDLASWGADEVARSMANGLEELAGRLVADWALRTEPFCIIGPSTTWGREVMGRVAARLGAGLTGDAVELELIADTLTCWKPAFGGQLVAAVNSVSPIQMVTVRPGVLPVLEPRIAAAEIVDLPILDIGRVKIVKHEVNEGIGSLASARRVVGLGLGVYPEEYPQVHAFCRYLGAELASTRKVTDRGWMARGTQIGITGLSIAPDLYIAIGVSGTFNHMVGIRRAGIIVAINPDETAPVFDQSDIGIVHEWGGVAPHLIQSLVQLDCQRENGALSG